MTCNKCEGEGWVCEDHPDVPWGDGMGHSYIASTMTGDRKFLCEAAGMPCECNKAQPPWHYNPPCEHGMAKRMCPKCNKGINDSSQV